MAKLPIHCTALAKLSTFRSITFKLTDLHFLRCNIRFKIGLDFLSCDSVSMVVEPKELPVISDGIVVQS